MIDQLKNILFHLFSNISEFVIFKFINDIYIIMLLLNSVIINVNIL